MCFEWLIKNRLLANNAVFWHSEMHEGRQRREKSHNVLRIALKAGGYLIKNVVSE